MSANVVSHLNLKLAPPKVLALAPVFLLEERALFRANRPAASLGAEGGPRLQREVAAEADRPGRGLWPAVEGPFEADELPAGNVPRRHEFPEYRDYEKHVRSIGCENPQPKSAIHIVHTSLPVIPPRTS